MTTNSELQERKNKVFARGFGNIHQVFEQLPVFLDQANTFSRAPGFQPHLGHGNREAGATFLTLIGELFAQQVQTALAESATVTPGKSLYHPHLELGHRFLIEIKGVGWQVGKAQIDHRIRQRPRCNRLRRNGLLAELTAL